MATLTGIHRGIVVSTADPQRRGRLKVEVPDVPGSSAVWALPCVPAGSRARPAVGAMAWVMFERGDPSAPVWLGVLPTP
jgi:hypothetical protein